MEYIPINNGKQYVPGIYIIESKCGKVYVGSATQLRTRYMCHRQTLRDNEHDNDRLQNYYNKYGVSAINFRVIELCDRDQLLIREQFYIDSLNPFFNIARTSGANYGLKPWLGRKHDEATKKKISASNLAANALKPKKEKPIKLTVEQNLERWRNINKSPEGRQRRRALHLGNQNWLGKKHKPETIAARIGALNGNSKKVYCAELDKTFETCKDAYLYFGLGRSSITNSISKGWKIRGKYTMSYVS